MQARVLFLESFYGGSHRDFADGLAENSRHSIELVTLPGHSWKWRIRAAALSFFDSLPDPGRYDLVFVTDLIAVADLVALWPVPRPPLVLFMHENQLSYPVPADSRPDYHFGFSNITSALAADRLIFNSHFHMCTFFDNLPRFLNAIPDFNPERVIHEIKRKSSVLYPGCRFDPCADYSVPSAGNRPIVVWNHRWEFDKNPDGFFGALSEIDEAGIDFDLVILGECSQKVPKPFIAAKKRYGSRLLNYGYVDSKEEYYRWLGLGDVVVSTAIQENFGIAVIEAIKMGCFPLLPERLSYPEVLPERFHDLCLYRSRKELVSKLKKALTQPLPGSAVRLPKAMDRYAWKNVVTEYDSLIESAIMTGKRCGSG